MPASRPRRCYNDAVYLEDAEEHGPGVEIDVAVDCAGLDGASSWTAFGEWFHLGVYEREGL